METRFVYAIRSFLGDPSPRLVKYRFEYATDTAVICKKFHSSFCETFPKEIVFNSPEEARPAYLEQVKRARDRLKKEIRKMEKILAGEVEVKVSKY